MATKLGSLTLDLICRTGNFTQGMRDASNSASREMGRIESSTHAVNSMLKQLATTAAATFTVSQVVNYADSYTGMVNKLKLVTTTQTELKRAMDDTNKIALGTASDWAGVVDVYTKFQKISDRLGLSQKEVARITETVTKSVSMSGASADEAQRSLIQFSQGLSLGVLRGQDLNSVMQQTPGLTDAIAKGMGVSSDKLKQMGADNVLTTESVVTALKKVADSVDEEYAKTATTVASSFNLIKTESIRMIGEFDSATGASAKFVTGMTLLAENMETVTNTLMIGGAYLAGTYIPTIYKSVVAAKTKIATLLEEIQIENAAIVQTQRKAQAEYNASQAELTRARDAVVAAEMQVNANRAVIGSEIQRIQATIAATNAEKAQEIQNHKSQITDIGRSQSVTRMAQLQQVLAAQTVELTALEGKLASTTLASSNVYVAARNAETAATGRAIIATNELNIANSLTTRSSMGLVGALGGPVGLGLTVAAVAGSYLMFKDSTKDTTASLDLQKGTVSELVEEYSKLDELQKRTTMRELEKQVKSLGTSYTVAYSDLSAMIGWLEESGSVSESTAKEINKLFKEYNKGKISSSEFATGVNNLSGVQKKHKVEIDELTTAHAKADAEYKKVKNAQQALINQTPSAIKANNDETDSIDIKRRALEGAKKAYTEYSKTALSDIQEMAARAQMQKMGFGDNQIAERMKVLKALNFDPAVAHSQTGIEMKKLADLTAKMKDSEDARSDAIKAQNKSLERQNELQKMVGASALSGLRIKSSESVAGGKVRGYTAEFAQLTQDALGDKLGRFTSFNDAYHKGTNSKHATGNAFDFTTKSAKDAELAIARLNTLAKQYGFTIKTLNEYSNPSARATGGHVHVSVLGYKGGEEALKDAKAKLKIDQDYNADRKKEADEVDQFLQQYSNADVVRNKKRIAEIAQAEKLGQTKLIPKINERFSNETRLADLQLEEQLKGWSWAEDEKLKHQAEINKTQIALSTELDDIEKQLYKESIDDRLAYELQQYRKTQLQKQFDQINSYKSIQSQIKGLSGGVDDIFAKATMSPKEYASWSLKNNRDNAHLDLKNQLVSTEQNIATSDSFSSEDDRYQALLDAHQEYLYAKSALDVQYDQQHRDLENQTQAASLAGYGAMFGMMGSMFDAYGDKESTGYKVAFAMQKAFVLSSAILNAKGAVMAAWNDPANTTIWQKMAAAAATVVQTNDLMSAIQGVALTGMAHDGIANVPEEGTWLLSKGERVLNPQDNKALTNMINNGGGGGDVSIQVSVTDSGINTSGGNTQNQKQLGDAIGNAVRAVIIREKRQGGLLSK
ncbi:tape measure protein [Acinetobacter guillouiae]|uniref:tape measure protein n=1 Tax=Acinetobacter guillouiae TaxID=106649 RepID=UPI003AF983B6